MNLGNRVLCRVRLHVMKLIAALLAVIALAACGGSTGVTTSDPGMELEGELGRLAAARQQWAAEAPADYTVSHFEDGETEPQTLAMRDGEVVSLGSDSTTIDEAFAAIEESVREGASVEVDYDPDYGYPTRIDIDRDSDGESEVQVAYQDLAAMPIVKSVAELHAAQRRWEAQQLDSYRYIFRFDCTCPEGGTFQVDVRDGRVVDTVALDDAAHRTDLDPALNIDSAFADLEEWFTNSGALIDEGILDVDVRMDPMYGYPRWFRIEAQDVDDEFFDGRFTMVVTIDLIAKAQPVEPEIDLDDLEQVESAAARWQEAALTDYRYVLAIHCLCPEEVAGPFDITIADGELDSVRLLSTNEETGAHVFLIDDALEMIGLAVVDGTDVDVVYDPILGYPEQAIIDTEAVAVDGGLAFSISDFEVLD